MIMQHNLISIMLTIRVLLCTNGYFSFRIAIVTNAFLVACEATHPDSQAGGCILLFVMTFEGLARYCKCQTDGLG
jgi:hypothetical protein